MNTTFLPSPDIMQSSLRSCLPDFTFVQWLSQINSTNIFLLQAAKDTQQESVRPALIGAHYQTSGKGRLGRKWANEAGGTLMFSCAYDVFLPDNKLPMLAPVAGIVACEELRKTVGERFADRLMMKWPNDIQYQEAKLSGLLVETVRPSLSRQNENHRVVVVGMGMNLAHAKALSITLGRRVADWTSVLQDMYQDNQEVNVSIAVLVARIAKAWQKAFSLYEQEGFAPFVQRHTVLDALAGKQIDVWSEDKFVTQGIARGLNDQAHLLLEMSNGQCLPLMTGDITVRPHE
ncbi:biotin--[acetyl-CoA-carboxylase] ligase [Pelistega ratti]|uniref:biotin--[acetyl-CoA-carboxylase] ligase n=1 Tax=Pelistega ratti TaxID=2652177 RepID=UPI00135B0426|nr:biotin--[acetyl-CoA-carboxylase] ligase [Pelistega ratti]